MNTLENDITEAIFAAEDALQHLYQAKTFLKKARNWGIFDIVAGGFITSIIKHKYIENAQDEIRYAKVALENLTRELQDVGDYITVDIEIDTFAKVTDYLLDNFVSDIYVQSKINNASQQVDDAIYETEKILNVLKNAQQCIFLLQSIENVERMLKNAPVKRPNGDGEIHALSGLMYCKDCGTKMHIRTIHKNGKIQYVTYCSEYAKGKAKHPKCNSPHRIDVDDVMENLTEVLRKIAQYSLANKEEFEVLVKSSLAKEQTEEIKKQKSVSHKSQTEWNRQKEL